MSGPEPLVPPVRPGAIHLPGRCPWPLLLRFLGGACINTAFGYTVFVLLIVLGSPTVAALFIATVAGVFFNFQTSRVVFRSRRTGLLSRFAGVYLVVLALNYMLLVALDHVGLQKWLAQALLTGPLGLTAFLAQRFFVFQSAGMPSR